MYVEATQLARQSSFFLPVFLLPAGRNSPEKKYGNRELRDILLYILVLFGFGIYICTDAIYTAVSTK